VKANGRRSDVPARDVISSLRLAVGPAAFVAFFLPIAHGPSLLSAYRFTGLELVALTGRLQTLDLDVGQGAALWMLRVGLLCVPVAAAWQTLLAPFHRWHPGYAISGWFLVGVAALLTAAESIRSGFAWPSSGLWLLFAAAIAFVVSSLPARR
jgi:hypothetical protein